MAEAPAALILDLLEWVEREPRSYGEVMEAWRTSCPRLPVWEDALEEGFVRRARRDGSEVLVELTTLGHAQLTSRRDASANAVVSA